MSRNLSILVSEYTHRISYGLTFDIQIEKTVNIKYKKDREQSQKELINFYVLMACSNISEAIDIPYEENEHLFPLPITEFKEKYRYDECGYLEKRCSKCDEWWPLNKDCFRKRPQMKDGFHNNCKACQIEAEGHTHCHLEVTGTGEVKCKECGIFKPISEMDSSQGRVRALCNQCHYEKYGAPNYGKGYNQKSLKNLVHGWSEVWMSEHWDL